MSDSNLPFHELKASLELPTRFNNPFDYEPHPLCLAAADEVQHFLLVQPTLLADAQFGKMFGVLIVEQDRDCSHSSSPCTLGFLAAYSGLLAGRNDWPYFVPPVYDAQQPNGHFKQIERAISAMNAEVKRMEEDLSPKEMPTDSTVESALLALKRERKEQSEALQLWLFRQYRMLNARGEQKDLVEIWRDYHSSSKLQQRFPLPPGGSGDCCAPKLLQYAYQHNLHPIAIAEFWYGNSPKREIRHHGQYYPACRGKCLPILTFMLQGLAVADAPLLGTAEKWRKRLHVLYVDDTLLVIEKPSGLLSVPGRIEAPSVESILTESYGQVLMPHRLDMDTSGLMVVARNDEAYKHLQQQFYARTIYKRYEALLDLSNYDGRQTLDQSFIPIHRGDHGTISLSLRPDPLDRPRQIVDLLHGKQAITDYEVLGEHDGNLRVSLTPHTGRTHQLRVHCAHPDGLGMPIVGDNLYGRKAHRLCLHAAELAFNHPLTGERMHFETEADFTK